MNKIYRYLPIVALMATTVACSHQVKKTDAPVADADKFDVSNLDTTVAPGNNFFQYAAGGWNKANPIPKEYSRYGTFERLEEKNQAQIKGIIEDLSKTQNPSGSLAQKIGDLYKVGMDSVKLNADGAKPIQAQLEAIKKASNRTEIIQQMGDIMHYASDPFFEVGVAADMKNSNMNLVQFNQGGLGLGQSDFYTATDSASLATLKAYHQLMKIQFVNAGYTEADAAKAADAAFAIENEIAHTHFKKEDLRKPELNYHKIKVSELAKTVGNFDWKTYFAATGLSSATELSVNQIAPVRAAVKMIQTKPLDDIKAYLAWNVINAAAPYLSDNFEKANFDFYGKQLSGRQVNQPRWKRVVNTVSNGLGEAVGQMYVKKYFPPEAKERMLKLVKNLQATLGERIQHLTWMSEATKAKAKEKLSAFTIKIGYPDKWIDYTPLTVNNDSYWANIMRANRFEYNRMLAKVNKPVDRAEWQMTPQMVNAYYEPTTNEICFPAGILQAPFFYKNSDDAVNYGAIGVVIGHEMSHGFDDEGCKFDKTGNMNNWWTPQDAKQFKQRAQVLVDHFNSIEVLPGLHANGQFTLGENIGDFGGLQVAYNAFSKTDEAKAGKKIDGFTPQQRFFLAYGNVWAGNVREAEIRRRVKMDPHSLSMWRVNGTLPEINAWYDAFHITPKDSLFIPADKRADIW